MNANEYRIKTRWYVKATADEIGEIMRGPEDLVRWWPATWRHVQMRSGEAFIEGSEFEAQVKGWLPYTLRFRGRVEEARYARNFRMVAWGDFEGVMECHIHEQPPYCEVCFDWRVRVEKAIVRRLSFFFKLLFWTNHIWVMRQGLKGMRSDLARHRGHKAG